MWLLLESAFALDSQFGRHLCGVERCRRRERLVSWVLGGFKVAASKLSRCTREFSKAKNRISPGVWVVCAPSRDGIFAAVAESADRSSRAIPDLNVYCNVLTARHVHLRTTTALTYLANRDNFCTLHTYYMYVAFTERASFRHGRHIRQRELVTSASVPLQNQKNIGISFTS